MIQIKSLSHHVCLSCSLDDVVAVILTPLVRNGTEDKIVLNDMTTVDHVQSVFEVQASDPR